VRGCHWRATAQSRLVRASAVLFVCDYDGTDANGWCCGPPVDARPLVFLRKSIMEHVRTIVVLVYGSPKTVSEENQWTNVHWILHITPYMSI
jgi:hypothetical protein